MNKSKSDKDSQGQFKAGNLAALKHGAFSLRQTGRVPSVRGVRQLRQRLNRLRDDIQAITPGMNPKKALLIEQIIRCEGQISLIEMYLRKAGIVRPDRWRRAIVDLQPSLANSYLAFLNTQRHAILALGLDEDQAKEVLTPFQIVEQEKEK